jgi:hypothetical protein
MEQFERRSLDAGATAQIYSAEYSARDAREAGGFGAGESCVAEFLHPENPLIESERLFHIANRDSNVSDRTEHGCYPLAPA